MNLLSDKDQNCRWVAHISEVLNQPISIILLDLVEVNNVTDDADISTNDISKDKTEEGLTVLVNIEAAGLDFILVELLKWGDAMVVGLIKISSMFWNTLKVSCELNCGANVKVQKRGNLIEYDHWRGVAFLIIVRKCYAQSCWNG